MKKNISVLILFFSITTMLFSQSASGLIGIWKVENQFENTLHDWYLMDDIGLTVFTGDSKVKPLEMIEFQNDGMALFTLKGGERVKAFYRAEPNGYYIQPQGGKDTTLFFQPIVGNLMLVGFSWQFPAGTFTDLILILSKGG